MKIRVGILLLFSVAAFTGVFGAAPAPPPPTASPTATCVFTNPGFAGKCQQNAAIAAGSNEQKTCESILKCLNDTRCTATFCQATEIRGGWKLESAKVSSGGH
jgi:hypothetical protein